MSKVVLRRPRKIFGAKGGSTAQPAGRPKSWGEFHQNFRSVSQSVLGSTGELTINEEESVEKKKRANSSSLLLDGPTFRSVSAPRRSTSTDLKPKVETEVTYQSDDADVFENKSHTTTLADEIKDKPTLTKPEAVQQKFITPIEIHAEIEAAPVQKIIDEGSSADESCDSAIAVSLNSTNQQQQDTISNLSSSWSNEFDRNQRTSYDLESISTTSNCDATETDRANQQPPHYFSHKLSQVSSETSSTSDVENYDADRSTEESMQQPQKSLRARKQQSKRVTQQRQTFSDEDVPQKNIAHSTGTWPRRKKDGMDKSPDELMRQFRELAADHMSKMRSIYSDSRRKIDDILLSLKLTMTKNGYNTSQRQRS